MRPLPNDYSPQAAGYVALVPEEDILPVLQAQLDTTVAWWRTWPESAARVVHPPYTWELRQALQHMADCERIFGYRMLRIARGDQTPLPGFDEDSYADRTLEVDCSMADTITEFVCLRQANLIVLRSLPPAAWERSGTASDARVTVRGLAYIMAGHVRHHEIAFRKRMPS
ncbi:MAG: DinB family protein [Pirellulaceae bacterium]|nr:DinB family protein [Pirellulaceae bacterium]